MDKNKTLIKNIATEKGIKFLLHFSRIENLESILNHGLVSRTAVESGKVEALINDEVRADYRKNTISTTISHPNDKMFFKLRETTQTSSKDWCVIVIRASALWELDCLFFPHNAADGSVSHTPDHIASDAQAFESMFADNVGDIQRSDKLKPNDPTDVQAEVLIKNGIPIKYILGAVISDKDLEKDLKDKYPHYQFKLTEHNKGLFASRNYLRK